MKTALGCWGAILLATAGGAAAADDASKNEAFPQGWYIAPMFSYTKADSARAAGNGRGGALAIGHRSDIAAVELSGIYTTLRGDAKLSGGALDLVLGPYSHVPVLGRLYALVGFGVLNEQNFAVLQKKHSSAIFGDAGLGYLQPLSLFDFKFNLRAEARYRYDYEQPPHPDNTPSTFKDWVFNLGLQIPFSQPKPTPPPKPEPVHVVPPVAPQDSTQPPPAPPPPSSQPQ